MTQIRIIQWGKNRSVLSFFYPDTKENELMLVSNDYVMMLDEFNQIVN